MIAGNKSQLDGCVDFDTTVRVMARRARAMNAKRKESLEGGLAVSVVLW